MGRCQTGGNPFPAIFKGCGKRVVEDRRRPFKRFERHGVRHQEFIPGEAADYHVTVFDHQATTWGSLRSIVGDGRNLVNVTDRAAFSELRDPA